MPKHLHIALAVFIIALLASCTMEGPCEGSLTVLRTIPDITMAVGDTVFIDLINPRIFERPPDNAIRYRVIPIYGIEHVQMTILKNRNDDDRASLISIKGRSTGEVKVRVEAGAGCLQNETTFNITVQ